MSSLGILQVALLKFQMVSYFLFKNTQAFGDVLHWNNVQNISDVSSRDTALHLLHLNVGRRPIKFQNFGEKVWMDMRNKSRIPEHSNKITK